MAHLAVAGGTPVRTAPYPAWPQAGPEELEAITEVLDSGAWTSTWGTAVKRFEERFAAYQEARHGICVSSGEAALRLCLSAAGLPSGAEVIVPAYTFVASATAVLQVGGVPVFADVDPETYCLDPRSAEAMIGPDTAAIMPVHMGGLPADMASVTQLARQHGVAVIEDAAQAWGARFQGRAVGALGTAGSFSFHASKNITAGEGGIILTDDDELAARCRSLADCGRAEPGRRYEHVVLGGNYRMTEFQGAILGAQLGRYPQQLQHRARNARVLREELAGIPGIETQKVPEDRAHSWHLLIVRVRLEEFDGASKAVLVEALAAEGIPVTGGYASTPYKQPLFEDKRCAAHRSGPCPVAERACATEAVWIRQQALLGSAQDALDVAHAFAKVHEHRSEL